MWDTGRRDSRGQTLIVYRLKAKYPDSREPAVSLFEGNDFAGSPLHADDSNETVKALMNFLTLRPGDTDADYFAKYTPLQLAYCSDYAESLAMEVLHRFGEE